MQTVKNYIVCVEYYDPRAGLWYSKPWDAETAREVYATETRRLHMGGIRGVYLMRDGVVVAQARHCPHNHYR